MGGHPQHGGLAEAPHAPHNLRRCASPRPSTLSPSSFSLPVHHKLVGQEFSFLDLLSSYKPQLGFSLDLCAQQITCVREGETGRGCDRTEKGISN